MINVILTDSLSKNTVKMKDLQHKDYFIPAPGNTLRMGVYAVTVGADLTLEFCRIDDPDSWTNEGGHYSNMKVILLSNLSIEYKV